MHRDTIRLRRLRPESLKWLLGSVVTLIALTIALTIWLWHEVNVKRQADLAASIRRRTEFINARFDSFFDPLLLDLQALRQMGAEATVTLENVGLAQAIVAPLLAKYRYKDPHERDRTDPNNATADEPEPGYRSKIGGFMLANELGSEFKLTYRQDKWQQVRSDDRLQNHPWFQGAIAQGPSDSVFLTESYTFHTTGQEGITISSAFRSEADSTIHVVAFDIVLRELSEFIQTLRPGERDRLFLHQSDTVRNLSHLGHQINSGFASSTRQNLAMEDPVILGAMAATAKAETPTSAPRAFLVEKETWWVARIRFEYGRSGGDLYLAIPEQELGHQIKTHVRLLAVVSLGMLCALVGLAGIFAWLLLGQGAMLQEALAYPGHSTDSEEELLGAIAQGESDSLEFKSTLRWNLKADKPGKEIELACMKTLAAFLNSEGGTLMVGVEDNGNILGIEADHFPNEDKFLLHFNNLIRQHLGLEHAKYIHFAVKKVRTHSVLVVDCQKSDKPVFLTDKDTEDFYVRVGPGTRKLSTREVLKSLHAQ
jgi:Schlafen, AlbA_2